MIDENALMLDEIKALESYIFYKKNADLYNWFSEFSSERFRENLRGFKKHYNDIFSLLNSYKVQTNLELFCNEEGFGNIFFPDSNDILYKTNNSLSFCSNQTKKFLSEQKLNKISTEYQHDFFGQLHNKYINHIVATRKRLDQSICSLDETNAVPALLFLGVGLGYHIAETLESLECKNIIIVEPELDLFYSSLFVFDWKNLINYFSENNVRVRFVLGSKTDYILLYLRHFFAHHGSFLSQELTIYQHYSSSKNESIRNVIQNNLNYFLSLGFLDDSVFGLCHTFSNLYNGKHFVLKKKINKEYSSFPVFIIGAGPSLDKNIKFLRKFQDKAIIIACGTAIDSLYHAGIQPDFYANTERNPEIIQALELIPDKQFFNKITLLSTSVCHPKVFSYFSDSAIFGKNNELYLSFLSKYFKKLDRIRSIEGINPLVGNMGVAGALHLGFYKLYLFGLDNGKRMGENYLHSSFTSLYRQVTGDTNRVLGDLAEANFGGQVETNILYKESAYRMGEILESFKIDTPNLLCINCSDGIAIKNTIAKLDTDLVNEFEKLQDIDKDGFHQYVRDGITKSFDYSSERLSANNISYEYTKIADEILNKLNSRYENRSECIEVMESISEFLSSLLMKDNFYASCLNGSLQQMFAHILGQLFSSSDEKESLKEFKLLIDIVEDFLVESREIFIHIPDYVMGEHRKYYSDGKVGKNMPHCCAPDFPPQFKVANREYDDPKKTFIKLYE